MQGRPEDLSGSAVLAHFNPADVNDKRLQLIMNVGKNWQSDNMLFCTFR